MDVAKCFNLINYAARTRWTLEIILIKHFRKDDSNYDKEFRYKSVRAVLKFVELIRAYILEYFVSMNSYHSSPYSTYKTARETNGKKIIMTIYVRVWLLY